MSEYEDMMFLLHTAKVTQICQEFEHRDEEELYDFIEAAADCLRQIVKDKQEKLDDMAADLKYTEDELEEIKTELEEAKAKIEES